MPSSLSRQPSPLRSRALVFLLLAVLLDTIGFGLVIPVMPQLIVEVTGGTLSDAAVWGGWLLFVFALIQLFAAPLLGNLSDRFGRRPVLLASLTALGLDYLLMGFAPTLAWLFVGRSLAGLFGSIGTTANAYVVDITPPKLRAQNFGMLGAAWGLGFIIGPVLGGFLGGFGTRVPFFAAAGLALANVLYGLFVLPESLPVRSRRPLSLRRANPIGTLLRMARYPVVAGLLLATLFYQLGQKAYPTTWNYFTLEAFQWSPQQVGFSMGFMGILVVLVQAVLIRQVIPRLGEERAITAGLLLIVVGFVGFAFAQQGWQMYLFIIPAALGGFAKPAMRSLMSNRTPHDAQGELQGAISSLFSLTSVIAPLLMTQLFGYFTSSQAPFYFPGAPFLLAAVLTLICLSLSHALFQRMRHAPPPDHSDERSDVLAQPSAAREEGGSQSEPDGV